VVTQAREHDEVLTGTDALSTAGRMLARRENVCPVAIELMRLAWRAQRMHERGEHGDRDAGITAAHLEPDPGEGP
jgi:hypothetical protein